MADAKQKAPKDRLDSSPIARAARMRARAEKLLVKERAALEGRVKTLQAKLAKAQAALQAIVTK